ncbi:ankyrin repeat domain-containing protein 50-like [Strongylocentrotus purpuratus]|uniref:Uncharacterized protein n=1 Tax=Strongylocentrotus purpuratus TaxID=7668 RepID=A0A7M7SZQ2_STRPU|nr:ankyrin repeat domain-containing protein 50-like [Strongylocentrotus purpuratus]
MALFSAAAIGDVQKIQSLIVSEDKSEDSGGVDVNCSDASGKTALHIASENGHLQTVKCLTNLGAKLNVVDANLQTSVHLCSQNGHLHVVELLVNEGADIDVGEKDGFTALHIASFNGHVDIVKYLVSKGADLGRLANDYWTPLHLALDGGHLDIAEYLLTEGANINTSGKGHLEVVQYIVDKGAGIEIGDKDGLTGLHIASVKGHVDIVKYLEGHLEVVEYIVNKGAGTEAGDKDGVTALHIALLKGHVDIDTIQEYRVAFPGEQYCVYWGQGPLLVRHLENGDEVSTQELKECALFDMRTHRMSFNLQPREQIVSRVRVTLILKQKLTKSIVFPVIYNDVPDANPIAQSTLTGSASSKGKAEPTDVGRGTSKSSHLSEELTRSEHHLETIGSTSPEPADTEDGSSHTDVFTRPRPLTSPSIESPSSEHAYQVTHDLVTETGAIGKELKDKVVFWAL